MLSTHNQRITDAIRRTIRLYDALGTPMGDEEEENFQFDEQIGTIHVSVTLKPKAGGVWSMVTRANAPCIGRIVFRINGQIYCASFDMTSTARLTNLYVGNIDEDELECSMEIEEWTPFIASASATPLTPLAY